MKSSIIIITSILLIASCNKDNGITQQYSSEVIPNGKDNRILPLSIGNIWNYKEYDYQDDELLTQRDVKLEVLNKIHVEYNGENLEVVKLKETRFFSENDVRELYFLLRNENDTVYWYGHSVSDNGNYYFNKTIYIKYPIQIGENWIMDHGDYGDIYTCKSIDDIVTIENKNYKCVRIRMGPGHWYEDKYFSLDVGIIQIESATNFGSNNNLTKRILISSIIK